MTISSSHELTLPLVTLTVDNYNATAARNGRWSALDLWRLEAHWASMGGQDAGVQSRPFLISPSPLLFLRGIAPRPSH